MNTTEIHLIARPQGLPTLENFEFVEKTLPALEEGQVLLRNLWLTVDPYMRGRMIDRKSYVPPFALGEPMEGGAIGEVMESRNPKYPVGMKVNHTYGWRTHVVCDGANLIPLPETGLPDQAFLGVMGMPGMTAWVGLIRIARLTEEDTVFVSGAAGAVGSTACQIAKLTGCRVIGSAGSEEKTQALKDMGVDATINYRETSDLTGALHQAAPQGIDVYFDNVGGDHLQAAIANMNPFGRIVACGMISQYNDTEPSPGPNNLTNIVSKRLRMEGFIVTDHWEHYTEFATQMGQWIAQGKVTYEETVYEGIQSTPEAFIGLFQGKNKGKMLIKL